MCQAVPYHTERNDVAVCPGLWDGLHGCMQEGGQVYNRMEEGSVQDSDTEGVPTGPPKHWTLELCARYRLAEFCFLLIVLIVGAQDSSFRIHKQQYVPQVRQPGVIPNQKATPPPHLYVVADLISWCGAAA